MFQEDAEQREYDAALRAQADYRRRHGTDGPMDLKRDDWMEEDGHGNALAWLAEQQEGGGDGH